MWSNFLVMWGKLMHCCFEILVGTDQIGDIWTIELLLCVY